MKTILFSCIATLALGLATALAEEAAKAPAAAGFSDPAKLTEKAPDSFKAQFDTTKGEVHH
jgi:hypothetical protein